MSRKKIPSKKALVQALRENKGNMAAAARRFHCHRSLVLQYVSKDPELQAIVEEETETFIDIAENMLYRHILKGNVVATIFFLKTKARHRGYSERLELIPLNRKDIEVELGSPTAIENHNPETLHGDRTTVALLEQ